MSSSHTIGSSPWGTSRITSVMAGHRAQPGRRSGTRGGHPTSRGGGPRCDGGVHCASGPRQSNRSTSSRSSMNRPDAVTSRPSSRAARLPSWRFPRASMRCWNRSVHTLQPHPFARKDQNSVVDAHRHVVEPGAAATFVGRAGKSHSPFLWSWSSTSQEGSSRHLTFHGHVLTVSLTTRTVSLPGQQGASMRSDGGGAQCRP